MMLPAGTVDSAPLVRTPICSQMDEGDRQPDEVAAAVGPRAVVQHGFGGGYCGQGQRSVAWSGQKGGRAGHCEQVGVELSRAQRGSSGCDGGSGGVVSRQRQRAKWKCILKHAPVPMEEITD